MSFPACETLIIATKTTKRSVTSYLISILIGLLLINAWMYYQQPGMLFYPLKELNENPRDWGMSYIDVAIHTEDGLELDGWYVPFANSKKVVLFFHGNAGNISHRRASLQILHDLGVNVLMLDYRGYGLSEGSPSESGLYLDARAAWDYLLNEKKFSAQDVVIFGRSLGGAVAVNLASQVEARGLMLESTFTSARDMADSLFPVLSKLLYVRFGLNSDERIKRVHCPVLILHSPDDDVIPYVLGERLFELANEPKRFVRLRGDHNSGFYQSQPVYGQLLDKWMKQLH